jgi:hypothetical protein
MTRFEIDLLMGAGLPPKIHPIKFVLSSVPLLVIMIVAILLFTQYSRDGVTVNTHKTRLVALDRKIASHAADVAFRSAVSRDIQRARAYRNEAVAGLGKQTQFTPILVAIAEELPDTWVISKFSVERNDTRKTIVNPDNPHQSTSVPLVGRKIHLVICDVMDDTDGPTIQEFMTALANSEKLGPLVKEISMDERGDARLAGHDVVSYKIDCDLKPEE